MPSMTIALDGIEQQTVALTKPRTTLGRRPYNDIVMDHLAVSGEHAVFIRRPDGLVEVLDLNSTNGTYVNGKAITSAVVGERDLIEIGRYRIRVVPDAPSASAAPPAAGAPATAVASPSPSPATPRPSAATPPAATTVSARVRVIDGAAAGRELALTKVVTTLGKPGVAVAAITHRGHDYTIARVEGHSPPTVNGTPVGEEPVPLQHNDRIALAGTTMQFLIDSAGSAP